jgi:hypothetical protein
VRGGRDGRRVGRLASRALPFIGRDRPGLVWHAVVVPGSDTDEMQAVPRLTRAGRCGHGWVR